MLSDDQIQLLRDIGQGSSSFPEDKKHEVVNLLVRGYIERDGSLFRVTRRGQLALGAALSHS
jgi:hypothetical protein